MDNLSKAQRHRCMSVVRTRNTDIERVIQRELRRIGVRFRTHVPELVGRPDIVVMEARLAIFIDGDFWHGYRFPEWKNRISKFWRLKISLNRRRDKLNFARLRRQGWQVIRLWQHEVKRNPEGCVATIRRALQP